MLSDKIMNLKFKNKTSYIMQNVNGLKDWKLKLEKLQTKVIEFFFSFYK